MEEFIEKQSVVSLSGQSITLKPLTLKQTIALGSIFAAYYEKIKQLPENDNFLKKILHSLKEEDLDEVIQILSNFAFPSHKSLSAKLNLEELSSLFSAVAEINDFSLIYANFRSAFTKMKI
ncbi:hypothetical protein Dip518_000009 [Parelusimicrobium proximum]|uniref:hypothetical protein n=1 Tax=Parelusimicrobium proximum TaxID=3228953 RepID=UPI003D17B61C